MLGEFGCDVSVSEPLVLRLTKIIRGVDLRGDFAITPSEQFSGLPLFEVCAVQSNLLTSLASSPTSSHFPNLLLHADVREDAVQKQARPLEEI